MSLKYGKLLKKRNDSVSSANLLCPEHMDRSSSSSSVWLTLDNVNLGESSNCQQNNGVSSTPAGDKASVLKERSPYNVPKHCYLSVPNQSNDVRDDHTPVHCETSILLQCYESNSSSEEKQAPAVSHRHYYTNLAKCNLLIPEPHKPRSKSCAKYEAKRELQRDPKNLRRTLSRTHCELDTQKIPDIWCATVNRVGRLNTRLLDAIEHHNSIEVESMLHTGANPNATCRAGHISACHAAAYANSDSLHLLLKFSADKNRKDKFGRTPLHLAAWAGRNWTIAMLLDFPMVVPVTTMSVSTKRSKSQQVLRMPRVEAKHVSASGYCREEDFKTYVNLGESSNCQQNNGVSSTPAGDKASVLKERSPYNVPKHCYLSVPNQSNDVRDDHTPVHCETSILLQCYESNSSSEEKQAPAVSHRHYYTNLAKCNLLIPEPHKPRSKSCAKYEAKRELQRDPKNLRRTLSRTHCELDTQKIPDIWCATVNRVGRLNTRLLDAIEHHNSIEVESMLHTGANPNATCRAGHISACHAAAYANSDSLHLLLKFSADKNRKDKFGRTPLHLAAWAGRNWTIAMLLDFPMELQYKVVLRVTPEAEEEIKQLRPRLTSMIDVPCELPIISVVPQNWKDSIEHKCRRYMTLLPKFFSGWTPLHIASYAAHHDATRLLLAAGANPNSKDAMGQTPLDLAGAACYLESSKVHVDEYVKTIKTLIEFGGKLNISDSTPSNSALHTAVELGSVEAIQELLAVGAAICHVNAKGNTPLHECVAKLYQEPLQVLANHRRTHQSIRSIDVMNSSGYTVLHAAILASWVPGVCVALDAGAVVTLEAHDGKTAIHLAALQGNLDILDEILLNAAQYDNAINYNNGRTEPPIFCAIRSGNLDCVQAFLDAGASLKMTYYVEPTLGDTTMEPYLLSIELTDLNFFNMILHATAEVGNVDMLELLLDHDKTLQNLFCYKCPYLKKMIPVEFAAHHDKFHTFQFLLQKTIERTHKLQETFDHSRLLHIIAIKNREDLFKELMRQIPDAVQTAIGKGYYPLHDAARNSNRNLIAQLIHNGADLSETDEYGVTAISLVIDNLAKPTEFLAKILDDYINTSSTTSNTDCKITVDYRVLIPKTVDKLENKGQMRVLTALLKNKNRHSHRKLLAHPLVESFLFLKWKTLSTYFYLMVFLYCLFVMSLSAYTVSVFYYKDKHNKTLTEHPVYPNMWNPYIWHYIIYVTLGIVVIQELSCTNLLPKSWVRRVFSIEFWIKFIAYGLTIATAEVISKEYETKAGTLDWRRHLATVTLTMAWLNIMMLLSKTPMSGYFMQMFWVVSSKIIKIIVTFLFLILMFSFCFMIQFHSHEPFEGPWAAIVKTLVMMTSEFDYSDTFTRAKAKSLSTSIQLLRFVFVVFLILTAMVLMNLTIGVAVHDVQNLVQDGNLKRLDKQVGFLNRLEVSRGKKSFFHFLGLHRWFNSKKVPQTVAFKPVNDGECMYSSHIKEAITNKVQEQLNRIEKESESNKVELKLDKISQAVKNIEMNLVHHISDLKLSLCHAQKTLHIGHD